MIALEFGTTFTCNIPNPNFYLDPKNYPQLASPPENYFTTFKADVQPWRERPILTSEECSLFNSIVDLPTHLRVEWGAVLFSKGNSMPPHLDTDGDDIYKAMAKILIWVTPDYFEGRELVVGDIQDPLPNVFGYSWDDPKLIERQRIKPKTGLGYILDISNPNMYHAVTELTSDSPVATILGVVVPS